MTTLAANTRDLIDQELERPNLERIVLELRRGHREELYSDVEIYFNANGSLRNNPAHKDLVTFSRYVRGQPRKKMVKPNPNYLPPEQNKTFIDAIKLDRVVCGKPRHGWVNFTRLNGDSTHMTFRQFKEIAPKLVRGWLIGKFAHKYWHGHCEILCLEVLV